MKTTFQKGGWNPSDFRYVYSPICTEQKKFLQEDKCIVNGISEKTGKFDYVSLVTEQKFHKGAVLETHCSFEKYGAPLLVLSNDIEKASAGFWRYRLHFEVVAYENGVNVWRIVPASETTVDNTNLIRQKFPVEAGKIVCLRTKVEDKGFSVSLDDQKFFVASEMIPDEFHAGFTACEGINRFYDFSVTEE